jgi:hypothetical protein
MPARFVGADGGRGNGQDIVDHIVLTPLTKNPRMVTVDLEGVLARFLQPSLDYKGQTGTGTASRSANKKPPLEGRLICNQSWLRGQDTTKNVPLVTCA